MATFEKRTGLDGSTSYRVKVRIQGHPTATATFEKLGKAKEWASETETEIRNGRYFGRQEAKKHTLKDAIERYERDILPSKAPGTQKAQARHLAWWSDKLGAYTLAGITRAVVNEAIDDLAAEEIRPGVKRTPATVNRYTAAIAHVFSIAVRKWEWCQRSPLAGLEKRKEPRGRVRFLDSDERARLLDECKKSKNPVLYDVVRLALATGMRRGEIMGLTWNRIDFHAGHIRLEPENTKTDERRFIPLTPLAREILEQRSKVRRIDTQLVFPGRFRHGKEAQPHRIRNAWECALQRAEIEDFRFHDLRHSAASYLAMNGATLAEIAAVLGHKTLAMVQRYAHLSDAHTGNVLNRMNASIFDEAKAE